jgi:dienelactone hydrolase
MSSREKARDTLAHDSVSAIRFEIDPPAPFIDDEVRIRLLGAVPGVQAVIRASTRDDAGRDWRSEAAFLVDGQGAVDLTTAASIRGSYTGISQMGIFWSMVLDPSEANARTIFAKDGVKPNVVTLEACVGTVIVASAQFTRHFIAAGTITRDLKIPNSAPDAAEPETTVGRLFIPAGPGPHPAVTVLSGSGGGFDVDKAAVLARHGFATFALSYFGVSPLPSWLHRIPLEYFEAALGWLTDQPEIDANRIGAFGISRGAEAALLLASRFPQIRAVAAWAPSSTAWAAGGEDKATREIIPCWTWRGEPLPFAPLPLKRFMWRSAFPVVVRKRPVMFVNLFRAALRNRTAVERAAIPIEKISGPVLLVSGGDDHLWPAAEMAEALVARARREKFGHAIEHLNFPCAGHMLRYPHLPTTSRFSRNQHLRGARFSFGGAPDADAEAQWSGWRRSIEFLRAHL